MPLKTQPPAAKPVAPDDRTYGAFDTLDHPARLHIMRGAGPSRFPAYSYLLDMSFDHHLQSAFTLVYTFMIVEVTGRNLGPIVHAISSSKCERIREYHAKLYDPPGSGEPVIEKIVVTTADEKLKLGDMAFCWFYARSKFSGIDRKMARCLFDHQDQGQQ